MQFNTHQCHQQSLEVGTTPQCTIGVTTFVTNIKENANSLTADGSMSAGFCQEKYPTSRCGAVGHVFPPKYAIFKIYLVSNLYQERCSKHPARYQKSVNKGATSSRKYIILETLKSAPIYSEVVEDYLVLHRKAGLQLAAI